MNIIGIHGKAGSGKNAIAGILAAELSARGFTVLIDAFATPLKREIMRRMGWDGVTKDEFWRKVLQITGAATRKIDPEAYITGLHSRIHPSKPDLPDFVIITDVRYFNEANFVRKNGILWIICGRGGLEGEAGEHESEAGFAFLTCDVLLNNNKSIVEAINNVRQLIENGLHLDNTEGKA